MKKYDLEDELINSGWISEKCKNSEEYCKELYAALCNMQWQKTDLWPTLADELWSCSWRYSGSIVSRLLNTGNYMDWYCSGNEGFVSDEIATDLLKIGWVPIPYKQIGL